MTMNVHYDPEQRGENLPIQCCLKEGRTTRLLPFIKSLNDRQSGSVLLKLRLGVTLKGSGVCSGGTDRRRYREDI